MADGFVKLFSSILDSTLWQQTSDTKVVWITMLAMADQHGEVYASIPGVARRAGVSLEACERALQIFQQPDGYSRTPDYDGRRIEVIDGGWEILNYERYRFRKSSEHTREAARLRQQRRRERLRVTRDSVTERDVTRDVTKCHDIAEAEAEVVKSKASSKPQNGFDQSLQDCFEYYLKATSKRPKLYKLTPLRRKKGEARLRQCHHLASEPKLENAVALFKVAIDRFASDSFHNGQNEQGKKYLDWELLCRSDEKFTYWLEDQNFPKAVNQ